MADQRTFTLIGSFDDRISPSLEKINKGVDALKKNLADLTNVVKPLKSEFKDLADYSKNFSSSLKGQATDIRDITAAMRAMRNEMGRVNRAYTAAGRNRNIVPPPSPPPRVPGVPAKPGSGRPGSGISSSGGGGTSLAAAAGGFDAGSKLGEMVTGSIVRGFQMGVSIMSKPFRYAGNAFAERVRDEMTDIQSAGGLFATDIRYNLNMFKSFNEARRAQENINARLAQSAAELPGETAQYVREAKRITDTMIGAMGKSQEAFVKYAESIGAKQGDKMDALGVVIQKFTEKSVLLGMQPGGGQSGSRMYGVPQLLEMLVNMPKANMKSMSYKYAALRDNPLLANALQQGEAKINATAVGTAERLRAIMEILDQALPNEVVSAMRNSMDGVIQTFKSAFLDPEVGLFGLGRKLDSLVIPRVDSLGRYLDKSGNVVEDVSQAFQEQTSLYGLFRDILAGFAVPLSDLVGILPQIYDPLRAIGLDMVNLRNTAQNFLKTFNGFTKGFEELAKLKGIPEIKKTAGARGALLTIANLLQNVGKIDTAEFKKYSTKLQQKEVDLAGIAKSLFSDLFDSKFMDMVGEVVGKVIGGTIKMVGDLMAGVTDVANAGPFAAGLKKGWDAAKGSEGVSKVFSSLFKIIGNLLMSAFKSAPFEMSILTALTVGMPILSGLITAGMTALFQGLFSATLFNFIRTKVMGMIAAMIVRASVMTTTPAAAGAALSGAAPAAAGAGGVAGFGAMLARLLPALGKLSLWLTGIVLLGGGVENTIRQLQQTFGEIGHSVAGSFSGLFAVLGTLTGFVGDLGVGIGRLFNFLTGTNTQLDLLKILLTPITAALQALELGLLGLNLVLTKVRSWMSNWLGTEEEKKRNRDEALKAEIAVREAQGRQNAYNLSMQGNETLKKSLNNAIYELSNSKELKAARSAELKSFVNEARAQLGQKTPVPAGKPSPTKEEAQTATQTSEINKKSTQQIKETSSVKSSTDKTTQAVRDLTTKITPQTTLSTSVAAIYSLLASGQLRVSGSTGPQLPPGFSPPNPNLRVLPPAPADPNKWQLGNPFARAEGRAKGGLGDAIASEMRMKPPGSSLVVANSSETVIPAAGGYGMLDFVETLRTGFAAVVNTYKEMQTKQNDTLKGINATLVNNQQQTNAKFTALQAKMNTPSMPGGLGGGAAGGVDAFTPMAQRMGLTMTSGYRPGDPGWHGANRARDYSNSTGPTPQMMQFAQMLASNYGSNLKELIYTPLGFSIKNGQKVAPYAQGSHYNHVHVAYAMGLGQGVAFNSLSGAQAWEKSMVSGSVKVGSVTGNSAEGFGGGTSVTNNITIHQQPGQDADELASLVAIKIGEAVADARSASIFV